MEHSSELKDRRSISGVALRWSHLVIVLIVYVLTLGVIYGDLRSTTSENTRRIQMLEDKAVTREQVTEMKEDLQRRLQRIEDKLDYQKEMRGKP
jgi:hypothetical protein